MLHKEQRNMNFKNGKLTKLTTFERFNVGANPIQYVETNNLKAQLEKDRYIYKDMMRNVRQSPEMLHVKDKAKNMSPNDKDIIKRMSLKKQDKVMHKIAENYYNLTQDPVKFEDKFYGYLEKQYDQIKKNYEV